MIFKQKILHNKKIVSIFANNLIEKVQYIYMCNY